MPIFYDISPELNLLVYIGKEKITVKDYYRAVDEAALDPRRTQGMFTIIDLLFASVDMGLEDMQYIINRINARAQKGLPPEPTAILTMDSGMYIAGETINLLPSEAPLQLDVFYSIDTAISALGLSDHNQEVMLFWEQARLRA